MERSGPTPAFDRLTLKRLLLFAARQLADAQADEPGGAITVQIAVPGEIPVNLTFSSTSPPPADELPRFATEEEAELLGYLARTYLSSEEAKIVDVLGEHSLQTPQICERTKAKPGLAKGLLANLVERGVLVNRTSLGYAIADRAMVGLVRKTKR